VFNFGDLQNVPMVSSWTIGLVLIGFLLWAIRRAKKILVRIITLGLVGTAAFSFYASTLSQDPATEKSKSQVVKDTIKEIKDEFKSDK
jgi:hypothetical protein